MKIRAGRPALGERRYITVCGLSKEAADYLDTVNMSATVALIINQYVIKLNKKIERSNVLGKAPK